MINKFERKNGAANFNANIGIGTAIPQNDFDNDKVFPWAGIEEKVDEDGNQWVHIPKFYTKYQLDSNGNIEGRYVSQYKVEDDWILNPIFLRDGKELPFIEISKYLINIDDSFNPDIACTKTNVQPVRGLTPSQAREYVRNAGNRNKINEYSLMDIWTLQLIQDLFSIEYATTECQSIMRGCVYSRYSQNGLLINGLTDVMRKDEVSNRTPVNYHTGCRTNADVESGLGPMKYRGLENIWGNGQTFIDGIYTDDNFIYVCNNVADYGETEKYTKVNIKKLEEDGILWKLSFNAESKLCVPNALNPKGWYRNIYTGANKNNICGLYNGSSDDNCGLWSYSMGTSLNSYIPFSTFRMVRRPY